MKTRWSAIVSRPRDGGREYDGAASCLGRVASVWLWGVMQLSSYVIVILLSRTSVSSACDYGSGCNDSWLITPRLTKA